VAERSFDLIIVGGGPGGYVAAIRARQLGLETALVEREHLGGICLNWGCIPTKALLRASELKHLMAEAAQFGFELGAVSFDLGKVVERSRRVAKRLTAGVRHLMKKNGVEVVEGHGRLAAPGVLRVSGRGAQDETLRAPRIILATGARARALPGIEPDGERIWTYREAMVPESLPASLLVLGAGAIGAEFASFYRDMGSEVTLVEKLPRILPAEDDEISDFARRAFERQGIQVHAGAELTELKREPGALAASVRTERGERVDVRAERLILAVGITGNVEELGLENTAARVEKGHLVTGVWGETDEPGLFAIGDVAGPPYLAHKANHEGVACVEHIAGYEGAHPLDPEAVPGCTYSRPQIASLGLTERAARETGRELRIGRFPFQGNGKALAYGESEGLVKTIFDAASGELLGAHMVGPEVTEMIQGFAIARALETTEVELMRTIFPHPTISETMHEAVLAAFDRALHV